MCRAAVARMAELGAAVVEVAVKGLEPLRVAHATIITSEMLQGFKALFPGEKEADAAIKTTGWAQLGLSRCSVLLLDVRRASGPLSLFP